MALIHEEIVAEWLHRRGYFTIRNIKAGRGEIDLLAFSPRKGDAMHVEVSVCPAPIGYLSGGPLGRRTPEEMREVAKKWIDKKFTGKSGAVAAVRESLCPGMRWRFVFVHGKARYPEERGIMTDLGLDLVDIRQVLQELSDGSGACVTSSEASGIAEMFAAYGGAS